MVIRVRHETCKPPPLAPLWCRTIAWTLAAMTTCPLVSTCYGAGDDKTLVVGSTPRPDQLRTALDLYEALEWEEARPAFRSALAAGLSTDDQITAHWHLALLALAEDDADGIEPSLIAILELNPAFEIPEALRDGPAGRIHRALVTAREAAVERDPPVLQPLSREFHAGKLLAVRVRSTDASQVTSVELEYRGLASAQPVIVPMADLGDGLWGVDLPPRAVGDASQFSYTVRAKDEHDNTGQIQATVQILRKEEGGGGWIRYSLLGGGVAALAGVVYALLSGGGGTVEDTGSFPLSNPPGPPQDIN
jgi:hypothetical protein